MPITLSSQVARRVVLAGAGAVLGLAMTACGANFNAQTQQQYQPAEGTNAASGAIAVRNLLVLASADGKGVLHTAIVNTGRTDDTLVSITAEQVNRPTPLPAAATPHTSEAPHGSTTPGASETPHASPTPGTSETPHGTTASETPHSPATPGASETPHTPAAPQGEPTPGGEEPGTVKVGNVRPLPLKAGASVILPPATGQPITVTGGIPGQMIRITITFGKAAPITTDVAVLTTDHFSPSPRNDGPPENHG